jgi:hypothetical protein
VAKLCAMYKHPADAADLGNFATGGVDLYITDTATI